MNLLEMKEILHRGDEILSMIECVGVHREYPRRIDCEWTVDIDRDVRNTIRPRQRVQIVDDLLRPAYRERGDDDPSAARRRLANDRAEAFAHVLRRWMVAIAVRRLHNHGVGAVRRLRITNDR